MHDYFWISTFLYASFSLLKKNDAKKIGASDFQWKKLLQKMANSFLRSYRLSVQLWIGSKEMFRNISKQWFTVLNPFCARRWVCRELALVLHGLALYKLWAGGILAVGLSWVYGRLAVGLQLAYGMFAVNLQWACIYLAVGLQWAYSGVAVGLQWLAVACRDLQWTYSRLTLWLLRFCGGRGLAESIVNEITALSSLITNWIFHPLEWGNYTWFCVWTKLLINKSRWSLLKK